MYARTRRPTAFSSLQYRSNSASFGLVSPSSKIAAWLYSSAFVRGWRTTSVRKQQSGQASSTFMTTPRSVLSFSANACFKVCTRLRDMAS
ncbi:hypothetical protein D3C72_1912710 [compost metagenome]